MGVVVVVVAFFNLILKMSKEYFVVFYIRRRELVGCRCRLPLPFAVCVGLILIGFRQHRLLENSTLVRWFASRFFTLPHSFSSFQNNDIATVSFCLQLTIPPFYYKKICSFCILSLLIYKNIQNIFILSTINNKKFVRLVFEVCNIGRGADSFG